LESINLPMPPISANIVMAVIYPMTGMDINNDMSLQKSVGISLLFMKHSNSLKSLADSESRAS